MLHVASTLLLPGADLGFGLIVRDAVAGLDLAHELIATALDLEQVVIRELAPLLLHGAFGLTPAALDLLPDLAGFGLRGLGGGLGVHDRRQSAEGDSRTGGEHGN